MGDYLTRLDMRITESSMAVAYNATTDETAFTLPYLITADRPYALAVRATFGLFIRGSSLAILRSETVGAVTRLFVAGDAEPVPVFGGYTIRAERTESEFFPRDPQSGEYVHLDAVYVNEVIYAHSDTAYYRAEVLNQSGEVEWSYPFEGRFIGDQGNQVSAVPLNTGSLPVPIRKARGEFRVRLVNDTFLPASWQSATWEFTGKR